MRVCCTSASPVSQGAPVYLIGDSGLAPVLLSPPEMKIMSAPALATPAMTVPTPDSKTNFTLNTDGQVDILEVEYELLQVLDRGNIVMWRRGDERDAKDCVPGGGDYPIDLEPQSCLPSPGLAPWATLI